jgi:hypothetical protein
MQSGISAERAAYGVRHRALFSELLFGALIGAAIGLAGLMARGFGWLWFGVVE